MSIFDEIKRTDPDVMVPLLYKDLSDAQVRFISVAFRLALELEV